MKRKLIFNILIVLSAAGGFLSCSDTWLMYDTSQKDKLYFFLFHATLQFLVINISIII